jgi:transposase
MLEAIMEGTDDAAALADLARGRLRAKLPQLQLALEGRVEIHHRFLLGQLLAHIDFLEGTLATLQAEIATRLSAQAAAMEQLQTIPGVGATAAAVIVAEIGTDMRRFASAKHLASWAGLCPGNRQSGGKRLSGKPTKGNVWLRGVLGEVAWAIAHTKDNYLSARYHRWARRLGKNKAVMALAHTVLVIIYHMLREGREYRDLGADYLDQLDKGRIERHHVRRLEQLGYTVTLAPVQAA